MAKIIGTAGTAPAARKVNRTPTRKTVPISRVPGISQRRNYVAPKPHPAPRVIRDSGVANNAPVRRRPAVSPAIIRASRQFGIGLSPAQTMAQQHRIHRNAQARAAHLAQRADVLHALGIGPARTIRSVGFAQSPTMLIGDQRRGATLRDSGVANNPAPSYHGQSISPQAIQRAMAQIVRRGHSLQSQDAGGLLHAAGISDPFGSRTPQESQAIRVAARAANHEAVVKQFVKRYKDLSKFNYGIGNGTLSEADVRKRIAGASTAQLIHAMRTYQPSALQQSAARVQTEGLNFNLGSLRALPDALSTGLAAIGSGIHAALPSGVVSNAVSDAAFFPIGAVGAIATGTAHPKETLKALSSGFIGHAVAGDWHGALKVAHDHPLFTVLELQAAKALVGRSVGAGLRAVPGRDYAGLARAPVALIGEQGSRAIFERAYSKDYFNQLAQRGYDSRLKNGPNVEMRGKQVPSKLMQAERPVVGPVAHRMNAQVQHHLVNRFMDVFVSRVNSLNRQQREVNARFARANAPTRQHGGKDVRNVQARLQASWQARQEFAATTLRLPADQRVAAAAALHVMDAHIHALATGLKEMMRRNPLGRARQAFGEAVDRSLPSQPITGTGRRMAARFPNLYRPERDAVTHGLQGLLRNNPNIRSVETFREDLIAEQHRLMHAAADVHNPRRELAQQQAQQLQRIIENPKALANAEGVFRSAHHLGDRLNEQEALNVRLGLAQDSADRAKLFPFAQAKMGAEYGASSSAEAARFNEIAAAEQALAVAKREEKNAAGTRGRLEHATATRRALEAEVRRLKSRTQEVALRHADGTPLSNAEIHAAMRAHGVDAAQVAYLSHNENQFGPAAYYKTFTGQNRQNIAGSKPRTGEMFRQGATAYDYNTIIEQMVSHGTKAANAQQLDKLVHDIGIRNPDGSYLNRAEFDRVKVRMRAQGIDVQPIIAHQQRLSAQAKRDIQNAQDPINASSVGGLLPEMMDARVREGAVADRNIVAIPSEFLNRLDAHLRVNGAAPGGQALSSAFRKTVLPFSTKWMVGNIAEGVLRAVATAGAIPIWDSRIARRAWVEMLKADVRASGGEAGMRALRKYESATNRAGRRAAQGDLERHAPNARAAQAELLGMLFYGNKGLSVRRRLGTNNPIGEELGNHPAVHALGKTVDLLTAPSFYLNRRFEHGIQQMVLGKHMRQQIQEFEGSWVKAITAQKAALADAAKGLLDTPGQVRAAKMMDDVLGRYSRFSPVTRGAVQTFAPFLPWYLNSARFTLVTLPLHNPIKTGILVAVERQFEQDWTDQHKDIKNPGSLNTAIRRRDGGFLDLARYTPFGFLGPVTAGDYGQLASPLLPQFQGIQKALEGQDPFGQPLQTRGANGKMRPLTKGEQRAYIANTILTEFVPLLSIGQRIREGGKTGLPTSNILSPHTKPGTVHGPTGVLGGLNKAFNPVRPVYLRPPAHATAGSAKSPVDQALSTIDSGAANPSAVDEALKQIAGG